ncbi:MAG TPA: MBL fold metallo-hydrolase, partial [Methylomirabilota bacterium]|nr:MBL fold metallo-hydrolase [Methylomirabilota bacterium]
PPALTGGDIVGPAMAAEAQFGYTAVTPATGATIRRLAALGPRTLAVMHGSSFGGDAAPVLGALAQFYDDLLQKGAAAGRR